MNQRSRQVPTRLPPAHDLLDNLLREDASSDQTDPRSQPDTQPQTCWVGTCVNDRHPALVGRYRVRSQNTTGGPVLERWIPGLQGLSVRTGDRVLVVRADNWPEGIVTGVIDGFADRTTAPPTEAARIELRPDETVTITARGGEPLLEIRDGPSGPTLRLCQRGLALEAEGHLKIRADAITMQSKSGPITIDATAQVIVRGDVISLN